MPEPTKPENPQEPDRSGAALKAGFLAWRGKLIDLSKRNRALNYRPSRVSALTIVDEKPAEIYRLLVGDEKALTFTATLPSAPPSSTEANPILDAAPVPAVAAGEEPIEPVSESFTPQSFVPYDRSTLATRHRDTQLQCRTTPEGLDISLRRLADLQRTSIEEQGVNTLYLALGFLHYKEASQANAVLRAPLVLVPVMLERNNARSGFRIVMGDDEAVVNPSLVEHLRRVEKFKEVPGIPEPTEDPASLDIQPFFSAMTALVAPFPGWKVTEEIALAPFSFQKLVIYKDLEAHEDSFRGHPLVRRVLLKEGEAQHDLPADVRTMNLDRDFPPEASFQVLDADSSQLKAIAAATRGHDLVIHGPPGTGKSQTITNLIAESLGSGKRVLFVSEKMAALDVVRRRLTQVKLGEFCLELHSTKAKKSEVIEDLKLTLDASGAATSGGSRSDKALAETRGRLNSYARELHSPLTPLACTPYQALGEVATTFTAPRLAYVGDPRTLAPEALANLKVTLRELETLAREVAPIESHGWRDSRLTSWSETVLEDITKALEEARRQAASFLSQAATFPAKTGLPDPTHLDRVDALCDAADHLAAAPGMPAAVLRDARWISDPPEVVDLLAQGRECSELERTLTARLKRDALENPPLDEVEFVETKRGGVLGWLAFLNGRYRAIQRRWTSMRAPGCEIGMLDQAACLREAVSWKAKRAALDTNPHAKGWFGDAWKGASSIWDDLRRRVDWVRKFHEIVKTLGPLGEPAYRLAETGGSGGSPAGELRQTAGKLRQALATLKGLVRWPESYFTDTVGGVSKRLDELGRDLAKGAGWVGFARAAESLRESPAARVVESAFAGQLDAGEIGRAFRRALYAGWLEKVLPTLPSLASFSTAVHEDARRTFQQLDSKVLVEHQANLSSKLRDAAQSRYSSSSSAHRAFLQKEMAKQKRHRPLRVTLREAGEAIAALKPCFLMSPMSVSQFLPPDAAFDIVIFDEASQLPTEDAVTAICRGKKLVVVGDPKQLPPTDFFSVQVGASNAALDEDGEPILQQTESVLEEFQGAGLHQAHLEWHYRSAHESLIQFSNESFYGSRLVVFPAAEAASPEYGLKFDYLAEGRYEGAGLNPLEARAVAAAVIEHFRTNPHESLGVGTFNLRQQLAILDELERHRREDPSLEAFFARTDREPFFVKNLENIQGDERDVIFLSITYAKQADGRLRHNFGPLNREEGWRRLNVLVSRARKRMRVFSSLRGADIDPKAAGSQGPTLLRDFLQFAETGTLADRASSAADSESPFELEVGDRIREMGYLVDRQIGVGPYRIDLGVRHPELPGRFLAGIECDGVAYHSAPCARDRDRLRQQVLERRGWAVLRVWSTDWFRDRAGTLDRLRRSLSEIKSQPKESPPRAEPPPAPVLPSEEAVPEARPEYERPRLDPYAKAAPTERITGHLHEAGPDRIARHVGLIVKGEGPVHVEEVIDRLLSFWNYERRGPRLVASAQEGIAHAVRMKLATQRGEFLYGQGEVKPRDRGQGWLAERVCREEISAAAKAILGAAGSLLEPQLASEVRECLGLKRTQDGTAYILGIIQALVQQGLVVHSAAGLRLKSGNGVPG